VLVSEIMLQQTQVTRVVPKYTQWLEELPCLEAVSAAPLGVVLRIWQGLGYNRRAIALKRIAEDVVERRNGCLPSDEAGLRALPGVGLSTAAGVVAFAHDEPTVYLETNVRAVFLHECFPRTDSVPDREILPLARAAVGEAMRQGASPREWYYSLLDYGAHLKRAMPNPSRRSAHHARQSAFEGSWRQKRARLLRAVMREPGHGTEHYTFELSASENASGRDPARDADVEQILEDLAAEGFLARIDGCWLIAEHADPSRGARERS
jgi:A/G-specific adenine glycosylase